MTTKIQKIEGGVITTKQNIELQINQALQEQKKKIEEILNLYENDIKSFKEEGKHIFDSEYGEDVRDVVLQVFRKLKQKLGEIK